MTGPTGTATHDESLSVLDRALYALFARHVDQSRHALDRRRYRGADLRVSFDVYLARVYGFAWFAFLASLLPTFVVAVAVPTETLVDVGVALQTAIPFVGYVDRPQVSRFHLASVFALVVATVARYGVVRLGSGYLRWVTAARRSDIERTLPGAVRYLHALSSGSDSRRAMLRKVADSDAYGETGVAFRNALNTAALTGSVGDGHRRVARDTPSRELLAPFLLKFREHAAQGHDALANYLRMESRMLGYRQSRTRDRAGDFLELLAEMFIVLLVLPALAVIVLTVMSVLAPGLSKPVGPPLGGVTLRGAIVYGSAAFVLLVGVGSSLLVDGLRPKDQTPTYERPGGVTALVRSTAGNPASAAVTLAVPALAVALALYSRGVDPVNVALLAYVAYAVPVGVVAVHRARVDDMKDREIKDFVHAVAGHVGLGRPFPEAVELVARDVDLGALDADVADLAFNLSLTTGDYDGEQNRRTAALDRFVDRVGTPLAAQTIGLVTGALDAGSDAEAVFETLQVEIGRLYHEKRALRSNLLVYAAVGWTTALLVVGIVVAVNAYVLDGFAQLSSLPGSGGFSLDPDAVKPARDQFRFYVVTQATMLASGWFAGTASRGWYEALLHSGALVAVCYVVFAGMGMI